jgi:hypothetical protein
MVSGSESEARFDWRAFTPEDSPKTPIDLRADPHARDLATSKLQVGDPAYDFDLPLNDFADGVERVTGERFRLGTVARQQPVALIFGSYT